MEELAEGHPGTVPVSEAGLTPVEVGLSLGLSLACVAKLIDSGDIKAEYLPDSSHRVVRLAEVAKFQQRRDRRRKGRRRLAEAIESEALPY